MTIERHPVDQAAVERNLEGALRDLPFFLDAARKDARNLGLLTTKAMAVVACGCVARAGSPEIGAALRLAAQAHAALLATASTSGSLTVRLGDGEPVTYSTPADPSTVHVGRWIKGRYLASLCRDQAILDQLVAVSADSLRQSSTQAPEYLYFYMDALKALRTGGQDFVHSVIQAARGTDPERPDVHDDERTLYLDVPQLQVLLHAATGDVTFATSLSKAVEFHKKYWSKSNERRRDPKGFISVELTSDLAAGKNGSILRPGQLIRIIP